jgi:hypothetical protein
MSWYKNKKNILVNFQVKNIFKKYHASQHHTYTETLFGIAFQITFYENFNFFI